MLGFCSSARFVEHLTGPGHPERPDRIRAIHRGLREAKLITSADPFPEFKFQSDVSYRATQPLKELDFEAVDESALLLTHTSVQIEVVKSAAASGGAALDPDTFVGESSFEIARLGVGAMFRACDAVAKGEVTRAFVAARPPGHHAEPHRVMGFCLFNNVALGARYLQKHHHVRKIAIVDFDVHHGNGTQTIFYDDPSVLMISIHEDPRTCWPGSGYAEEIGRGKGKGFTLNVPMLAESGDAEYLKAFDERILPRIDSFRPEMILVSAGFDAHADDPLASVRLSDAAFYEMTHRLVQRAEAHCMGNLISSLEGGYDLGALARGAVEHVRGMQ